MQPTIRLERPRKVTIVQSIIEQIVQQIQMGKLKEGDKLPSERALIDMLHVSRSSVREALQGLAMRSTPDIAARRPICTTWCTACAVASWRRSGV